MASQPGCTFEYIWQLTQKNNQIIAPTPFSCELMIAIFWEESMFNNIAQVGSGTAVGYGQVEPAEFYRFNAKNLQSPSPAMKAMAQEVQRKGYLVHGLPPMVKNGNKTTLNGSLTDEQAVQVAMALVRDMHERKRSKKGILQGYAGVGFTGSQAEHLKGNGRLKIIDGWLRCEAKLQGCSKSDADAVMSALFEAKAFNQWDEFRKILFPHAQPGKGMPSGLSSSAPATSPASLPPTAAPLPGPQASYRGPSKPASGPGQSWSNGGINTAWGRC